MLTKSEKDELRKAIAEGFAFPGVVPIRQHVNLRLVDGCYGLCANGALRAACEGGPKGYYEKPWRTTIQVIQEKFPWISMDFIFGMAAGFDGIERTIQNPEYIQGIAFGRSLALQYNPGKERLA